jgi:hypothetical protein
VTGLTAAEVEQTAEWIASVQLPSGMVPWYRGGHADPWNHIEATMALAAGGRWNEVERAFDWLSSRQLADGSWCTFYLADGVVEPRRDPNVCTYVATGAWWCWQIRRDPDMLARIWPMLSRAVSWCLRYQLPGGEIAWSVGPDGIPGSFALLAANSSLHGSLWCAAQVADALGHHPERGIWQASALRVAEAVADRPGVFAAKTRWAMDWYYPVLAGAVVGDAARHRLEGRWEELVVDGLGVRCVADKTWVTAAETAECAMAATRAGLRGQGEQLLDWSRHLRADDGSYWTGCVHPACKRYPHGQKSTYSAAAVVIADHVLNRRSPAAQTFSDVNSWSEPALERGDQAAGRPRDWTATRSSRLARLPEAMHEGTPTPP